MYSSFCVQALEEAFSFGKAEIFNTNQGSQDTSNPLVLILKSKEIQISLNEKGRCLDNIWLERLWRSVKREDIYLREYRGGNELYQGVHKYFHHYNFQRSLQVLSSQTPSDILRPNAIW